MLTIGKKFRIKKTRNKKTDDDIIIVIDIIKSTTGRPLYIVDVKGKISHWDKYIVDHMIHNDIWKIVVYQELPDDLFRVE